MKMKKPNLYLFKKAPRFEIVKGDNVPKNAPLWVKYRDLQGIINQAVSEATAGLQSRIETFEEESQSEASRCNGWVERCEKAEAELQKVQLELADAQKINAETAENPGILLTRATEAEDQLVSAQKLIVKLEKAAEKYKAAAKKAKSEPKSKTAQKSK
jgi:chromosome segregation ATPase